MPPRKKSAASRGPASIAEDLPLDNKQEAMALIIERLENLTDKRYSTHHPTPHSTPCRLIAHNPSNNTVPALASSTPNI